MRTEGLKPTRTQLKELKENKDLSMLGHELLEEKNEALMQELSRMDKDASKKRKDMDDKTDMAFSRLMEAQETLGTIDTRYMSASVRESGNIGIDERHIMGVPVMDISVPDFRRDLMERGYSITDSNTYLDDASSLFEEALPMMLKVGEIESNSRTLNSEVRKTRRKVTALEDFTIPSIDSDMGFIKGRLDEQEREDFVRTKMIKKRR